MKRIVYLIAATLATIVAQAQPHQYSAANAHSHNNYVQPVVFWDAYNQQYGSIEADVFLAADSSNLWVAHKASELDIKKVSLDSLYLQPLVSCIKKNNGFIYADHSRRLQLMIDIKTDAGPALQQLITMIRKYPELVDNPSLQFVISGNRPNPLQFASYPPFIWFDGEVDSTYTDASLARIAMISAPLSKYTEWKGDGSIPRKDRKIVQRIIKKSHAAKKPIRFWGAPDQINAWSTLVKLQVDFINTDHVDELVMFFQGLPVK